jgi:hypothetical protein
MKKKKESKIKMSPDYKKKYDNKKKVKIAFIVVIVLLSIITIYVTGRVQGTTQCGLRVIMRDCENPIYPYGCKLHENATHCFIVDCQKIGGNFNSAFCFELKNEYGMSEKVQAFIFGMTYFGCPGRIETLGIHPMTGNENWMFD